jgi:hypothetical protein
MDTGTHNGIPSDIARACLLPKLEESVLKVQGKEVTGEVIALSGEEEDPVGSLRPELERDLIRHVGVVEDGESDPALTTEQARSVTLLII